MMLHGRAVHLLRMHFFLYVCLCRFLTLIISRGVSVLVIAALTGGKPVTVSVGCVVSNITKCSVCSRLSSYSWFITCCIVAWSRLSNCDFVAPFTAVFVTAVLSVLTALLLFICVCAVVVSLVTPQLTTDRAVSSMRARGYLLDSFTEFFNITA